MLSRSVVAVLAALLLDGPWAGRLAEDAMRWRAHDGHRRERNPIIFVHGCPPPFGTARLGAQFFNQQIDLFRSRGYPADHLRQFVFSGPLCASNVDYAKQLAALVHEVRAATGASRVDIVAHSMGALATRLYLRRGGHRYVRDFVSIGGGNHGSETAIQGSALQAQIGYPAYEGMKEMHPPYACEAKSSGAVGPVQLLVNGCLTPAGRTTATDESPGRETHYLSIWNTADEMVIPREAPCLNQGFQNDCSSPVNAPVTVLAGPGPCGPNGAPSVCPGHVAMLWDAEVMQMVFDFVTDRRGRRHQSADDADVEPIGRR